MLITKRIIIYIIFCCSCAFSTIIIAATTHQQKNKSQEQLISLNFRSINVRDLLQMLAEFTNKNVIISDKVTGKISLNLQNIQWQQALDTILEMQGLSKREDKSMLFIAPSNEINANLQHQNIQAVLLPLHHTQAEDVANLLTKQHNILSPQGNITFDQRTNTLIVAETTDKIAMIKAFLTTIDIPTKQLLIEARIITADDDCIKDLGLKFNTTSSSDGSNSQIGNTDTGHFGLEIAKLGGGITLDAELSALENNGHVTIISKPKLITTNHKAAEIESGEEIPYQESTLSGATNVAFKKAVLSLQVTPDILSADKTILHLQLNQDKVSSMSVNGVPAIQTQQIKSEVIVNNGETIALGGIYEQLNLENKLRTPLLSSIPILGALFSNKHSETDHKELLIFITTKIM